MVNLYLLVALIVLLIHVAFQLELRIALIFGVVIFFILYFFSSIPYG
jgi:hypothetical protein